MHRFQTLILLFAGSFASACAADETTTVREPAPTSRATPRELEPAPAPAAAPASIEADLARLRALDVFEVRGLVDQLPAEAYHCYGLCPGWEARAADADRRAAASLARLADAAEATSVEPAPYCGGPDPDETEIVADLEAIRRLGVIEVGDLTRTATAEDQHRYCGDRHSIQVRADRLHRIAAAMRRSEAAE